MGYETHCLGPEKGSSARKGILHRAPMRGEGDER
jgi:hypothetical protein